MRSQHSILKTIVPILFLLILLAPSILFAQLPNLIVCDDSPNQTVSPPLPPCTFNKLIDLAIAFMDFLIVISVPLATIAFVFAGFLMLTSAGNMSKVERAKGIFTKTMIGFIFILSAWLIVKFITSALLNTPFTLLSS